jgi:phosphoserine phosphatase RsbX
VEARVGVADSPAATGGVTVDWAVAERCMPGEAVSGDAHLVLGDEHGVLAAVIDGLGHGEDAAVASKAARAELTRGCGEPLDQLMARCDAALSDTRGAAVTLAWFDGSGMQWLAVGNVTGILVPAAGDSSPRRVPLRAGIVGARLPRLTSVDHITLRKGDVIVLATDGVEREFAQAVDRHADAHAIADDLLTSFARESDDALVLVARYLGAEASSL